MRRILWSLVGVLLVASSAWAENCRVSTIEPITTITCQHSQTTIREYVPGVASTMTTDYTGTRLEFGTLTDYTAGLREAAQHERALWQQLDSMPSYQPHPLTPSHYAPLWPER